MPERWQLEPFIKKLSTVPKRAPALCFSQLDILWAKIFALKKEKMEYYCQLHMTQIHLMNSLIQTICIDADKAPLIQTWYENTLFLNSPKAMNDKLFTHSYIDLIKSIDEIMQKKLAFQQKYLTTGSLMVPGYCGINELAEAYFNYLQLRPTTTELHTLMINRLHSDFKTEYQLNEMPLLISNEVKERFIAKQPNPLLAHTMVDKTAQSNSFWHRPSRKN
jgi:hypothetical protein